MITQSQRYQRSEVIGSSDAAAVLGLNPYKSAYDLWMEKTGRVPEINITNEACELGEALEDHLVDWAFRELRLNGLERDISIRSTEKPFMACNLDAKGIQLDGSACNIEAKTAGLASPLDWQRWGDEMTDEIPQEYIVQTHHAMFVAGLTISYVPALLGGKGRKLYIVRYSETLMKGILEAEERFWSENVLGNKPPSKSMPSIDFLKRARRQPNKTITINSDLVTTYQWAKDAESKASESVEAAKVALLEAMGDAENATTDAGLVVDYYANKRGVRSLRVKEAKEMGHV